MWRLIANLAGAHHLVPVLRVRFAVVLTVQIERVVDKRCLQVAFLVEDSGPMVQVLAGCCVRHRRVILREQDVRMPKRIDLLGDGHRVGPVQNSEVEPPLVLGFEGVDLLGRVHAFFDHELLDDAHIPVVNDRTGISDRRHTDRIIVLMCCLERPAKNLFDGRVVVWRADRRNL